MKKIYRNTDINDKFYYWNGLDSNNRWFNQGGVAPVLDTKKGAGGGGGGGNNCSSPSLPRVCCNAGWTNEDGHPICPPNSDQSLGIAQNAIALGSDPCPYTYNMSTYSCGAQADPVQDNGGITELEQIKGVAGDNLKGIGGPNVPGCTDSIAVNYNPNATVDDGSCQYPPPPQNGCTHPQASNYDPNANNDDGSCVFADCPCVYPVNNNNNNNVNLNNNNVNVNQNIQNVKGVGNFSGNGYYNQSGRGRGRQTRSDSDTCSVTCNKGGLCKFPCSNPISASACCNSIWGESNEVAMKPTESRNMRFSSYSGGRNNLWF